MSVASHNMCGFWMFNVNTDRYFLLCFCRTLCVFERKRERGRGVKEGERERARAIVT